MSVLESKSKIDENVKVVRGLLEAVFNQHNTARFGEFFEKNAKWHGGALGTVEGTQNVVGLFGSVFSAIPDLHVAEQEIVAQGDTVVV